MEPKEIVLCRSILIYYFNANKKQTNFMSGKEILFFVNKLFFLKKKKVYRSSIILY